jgi:hypothetical protein
MTGLVRWLKCWKIARGNGCLLAISSAELSSHRRQLVYCGRRSTASLCRNKSKPSPSHHAVQFGIGKFTDRVVSRWGIIRHASAPSEWLMRVFWRSTL